MKTFLYGGENIEIIEIKPHLCIIYRENVLFFARTHIIYHEKILKFQATLM